MQRTMRGFVESDDGRAVACGINFIRSAGIIRQATKSRMALMWVATIYFLERKKICGYCIENDKDYESKSYWFTRRGHA
jgi:hypothetical protein